MTMIQHDTSIAEKTKTQQEMLHDDSANDSAAAKKAGQNNDSVNINSESNPDEIKTVEILLGVDEEIDQIELGEKSNLNQAVLYLNRELTWLNFNRRVLFEAENNSTPLLGRVNFLAIASSNSDDFFMKRIGGLKQLIEAKIQQLSIDGRSPQQQLDACYLVVRDIEQKKTELYSKLIALLEKNEIHILDYDQLNKEEKDFLRDYFINNIYPLITPQCIDSAHPFPFISNLSLNLLVALSQAAVDEISLARVKIPVNLVSRFIHVENDEGEYKYVKVEDVVRNNLDMLFPMVNIESAELFRVTRNANTEQDEEKADDLLELIETELRDRKFAPIVRLEVFKGMDQFHLGHLCSELGLDEHSDVFEVEGMIGKRDLREIASLNIAELKYKPHHPIDSPRLKDEPNIFYSLRHEGPILLYHPYESFSTSIERFLREAADDPKVRAIKMTLYRTSKDTNVVEHLINAVQKGKQVAVIVEIKARFDEEANIQWANTLEEKGIHVTYGVVGFKTHAKVIQVVRHDYDGLRIYSHIGTGNYHAGTSRLYTDFGLLTGDDEIGRDLTELFNFLTTGYTPLRKYKKILMAPGNLKRELLAKIEREITLHSKNNPGLIQMKMNALEDKDIVRCLYKASRAGVKVDLIIRDTCRLRPNLKGLSENIRVISIIGRFLEHARLYYFQNGGEEEYFIGSADAMRRNLERRVEVLVPVESELLQKDLRQIIDIQLRDKFNSWEMRYDGSFERIISLKGRSAKSSQEALIEIANKRQKAAGKIKWLQSKGKSKKEVWAGH